MHKKNSEHEQVSRVIFISTFLHQRSFDVGIGIEYVIQDILNESILVQALYPVSILKSNLSDFK